MQLIEEHIERTCLESDLYNDLLELDDKRILELGCGTADITRVIAAEGHGRRVTAVDVDEYQIQKHMAANDAPNVEYVLAGAEAIPAADESFDIVLMFKSLHHVPVDRMRQAVREIHRVLSPGGQVCVLEPLFQGEFNEILRLFHDEEVVRREAFSSLQTAVREGLFAVVHEVFFLQPVLFETFEEFEHKIIRATHSDHDLSVETHRVVKEQFERHMTDEGARFLSPMRMDILRKMKPMERTE